jgi:L-fucose mutarotase
MLLSRIVHPEILSALGRMGHGSRVLIADGNYPYATASPPQARMVFLNLRQGMVRVTDVLEGLVQMIPIEAALTMAPPDAQSVPIHAEFQSLLPAGIVLAARKRMDFYAEASLPSTALVIATGEERRFANLLLTTGVVKPPQEK